jgi:cardiolipin synthase
VRRYQTTFIHTKTITVDGIVSVVGTANMNRRSTLKDDEVLAVVLDPGLAGALDRDFDRDARESDPLPDAEVHDRAPLRRVLERVVRPFRGSF